MSHLPSPIGGVDPTVKHHRMVDPAGVEAPQGRQRASTRRTSNTTVRVVGDVAPASSQPLASTTVRIVGQELAETSADEGPTSDKVTDILDWVGDDELRAYEAWSNEVDKPESAQRSTLIDALYPLLGEGSEEE